MVGYTAKADIWRGGSCHLDPHTFDLMARNDTG